MANTFGKCMDKMRPKELSRIFGSNNFHSHFEVISLEKLNTGSVFLFFFFLGGSSSVNGRED